MHNRTLLSVDFITEAKIQLDIVVNVWNFPVNGESQFHLEFEPDSTLTDLHITSFETVRPEGGQILDGNQR